MGAEPFIHSTHAGATCASLRSGRSYVPRHRGCKATTAASVAQKGQARQLGEGGIKAAHAPIEAGARDGHTALLTRSRISRSRATRSAAA
eukprot:1148577-Pelagomonas_calceolata.AAC.10